MRPTNLPTVSADTADALLEAARIAENEGQRARALDYLSRALYALPASASTRVPGVLRRIARCHIDDGDVDAGLDALETAFASAEAYGDRSGVAHAINLMAIAPGHPGASARAQ